MTSRSTDCPPLFMSPSNLKTVVGMLRLSRTANTSFVKNCNKSEKIPRGITWSITGVFLLQVEVRSSVHLTYLLGHGGRGTVLTTGGDCVFHGTRALDHPQMQLLGILIEGLMTARPFGSCRDEQSTAGQCRGEGLWVNSSAPRQEEMHLVREVQ